MRTTIKTKDGKFEIQIDDTDLPKVEQIKSFQVVTKGNLTAIYFKSPRGLVRLDRHLLGEDMHNPPNTICYLDNNYRNLQKWNLCVIDKEPNRTGRKKHAKN